MFKFEGKSDGLLVMWNNDSFKILDNKFNSLRISLFSTYVEIGFKCLVICQYDMSSLKDRKNLWEELTILNFAFEWHLYVIGDFNKSLS